jgi:hypothetical protein
LLVTLCSSLLFSPSFLSTTTTPLFSPFSPPCCAPLPRFWKVCLSSVPTSFICAPKGNYPEKKKRQGANLLKKRQGANILKTKQKRRKGKAAPYNATELHLGGRSFPLLGATPFPVLGFGAIFFLISDCQVLERRIPVVVSHLDLGAGLPL